MTVSAKSSFSDTFIQKVKDKVASYLAASPRLADKPTVSATKFLHIPRNRKGLLFLREVKKDILGYFLRLMQEEGAFAGMVFKGKRVVMLNDAAGIEYILQRNASNYHKSDFYDVLRPLLGNSIIMSEGEEWTKQRQMAAPAFSHGRIIEMANTMVDAIGKFAMRWDAKVEKDEPIDINYESMALTLNIMLRTLFSEDQSLIIQKLQNAITVLAREAEERIWFPFKLPQSIVYGFKKYRDELQFLDKIVQSLVDQRQAAVQAPDDLLKRLLVGYKNLPEKKRHLRDQVMTFLLAGHESTASGLTWSLYQLSKHPFVYKRMTAEIDEVLNGRAPTLDDLKLLPYTRQVFDEVLRTYPVVWTISRVVCNDDNIPLDDGSSLALPAGTVVMLSPYAVHRRETYWRNPEAFDPTHFNEQDVNSRPKYSYFPFGGGPRLCLGFRFAQVESLISLIMIAQRYEIQLIPGQKTYPVPSINLRPNGSLFMRFKKRASISAEPQSVGSKMSQCPYGHGSSLNRDA